MEPSFCQISFFFYIQVCEDEEVNYIHISCIIQQLCFFVGETNEHLYCFMLKETAGQLVTSNRNRCLEESVTTGSVTLTR